MLSQHMLDLATYLENKNSASYWTKPGLEFCSQWLHYCDRIPESSYKKEISSWLSYPHFSPQSIRAALIRLSIWLEGYEACGRNLKEYGMVK